ncbi:unnamed protein product [Pedinophyceae sp. YPF-701]|nr:unnamed protein product [Pedinophyceae sp. YPF-701]
MGKTWAGTLRDLLTAGRFKFHLKYDDINSYSLRFQNICRLIQESELPDAATFTDSDTTRRKYVEGLPHRYIQTVINCRAETLDRLVENCIEAIAHLPPDLYITPGSIAAQQAFNEQQRFMVGRSRQDLPQDATGGSDKATSGAGKASTTRNGSGNNNKDNGKNKRRNLSDIKCFRCDEYGHYASDCTAPPKKKQDTAGGEHDTRRGFGVRAMFRGGDDTNARTNDDDNNVRDFNAIDR